MLNKVILIGNVTKDPEIRSTKDGRELANFSIATNEKWKGKDGTPQEKVEYHRIVVFSQGLVGIVKNYVKKGSKLYVEGQLQTRKWTDNNGVDKYSTEIILNGVGSSLQMLDSRGSTDNQPNKSYSSTQDAVMGEFEGAKTVKPVDEELEDEIPF